MRLGSPLVEYHQEGRQVHLRGYGFIRVSFGIGFRKWASSDVEHLGSPYDLEMTEQQRESVLARTKAWGI